MFYIFGVLLCFTGMIIIINFFKTKEYPLLAIGIFVFALGIFSFWLRYYIFIKQTLIDEYYEECPNCGKRNEEKLKKCEYCNTTLVRKKYKD